MRIIVLLLISIFFSMLMVALAAGKLSAQSAPAPKYCAPTDKFEALFKDVFRMLNVGEGLADGGMLIQLWADESGDNWRFVAKHAFGQSCVVSAGSSGWTYSGWLGNEL